MCLGGRNAGRKYSDRRTPVVVARTAWNRRRKAGYYRPPRGSTVDGLTKLSDGRWKISGDPGQKPVPFPQPDTRRAVARLNEFIDKRASRLGTLAVHADAESLMWDLKRPTDDKGGVLNAKPKRLPGEKGYAVRAAPWT